MPVLIPLKKYEKPPSRKILKKYLNDEFINILFVGRVVPNKKHEDVISIFYQYYTKCNPRSRLFIVGSYEGMEKYFQRLIRYVEQLGLSNVYFTGHLKFDEILAYYKIADAFICMSEHEGFCVPLIEAMYFDIPILAYDSCAIADTLGGSGFLTNTKNPLLNAFALNRILTDKQLKNTILENEQNRLNDFKSNIVERKFEEYLEQFLEDI